MEASSPRETKAQWPRILASLQLPPRKALFALIAGALAATLSIVLVAHDLKLPGVFLAFALAWAAVIDIDRFKLPDAITLPIIGFGLMFAAMQPENLLGHATG